MKLILFVFNLTFLTGEKTTKYYGLCTKRNQRYLAINILLMSSNRMCTG